MKRKVVRKRKCPADARPVRRAMVPVHREVEFDRLDGTAMFDTLGEVRALEGAEASRAIVCRSVARVYRYKRTDLFAIAEIGRHYLESGGYRLAAVIFEGLEALEPDEHYFVMALGLAQDHIGDKAAAMRCYKKARFLDPEDGRADLNLAELLVESGQKKKAIALIKAAIPKALARDETVLVDKAWAMLALLDAPETGRSPKGSRSEAAR